MNVALTRAKCAVLFVGDLEMLAEADKHWAAFAKWTSGESKSSTTHPAKKGERVRTS